VAPSCITITMAGVLRFRFAEEKSGLAEFELRVFRAQQCGAPTSFGAHFFGVGTTRV
jgi:hypothetical protein